MRPIAVSPRSALATSAVQAPPEKRAGGGLKEFLKEKTGVTGAGTLAFGLAAFAISKEIIIIHSEVLHARTHTHTHTHAHTHAHTHTRTHTVHTYIRTYLQSTEVDEVLGARKPKKRKTVKIAARGTVCRAGEVLVRPYMHTYIRTLGGSTTASACTQLCLS